MNQSEHYFHLRSQTRSTSGQTAFYTCQTNHTSTCLSAHFSWLQSILNLSVLCHVFPHTHTTSPLTMQHADFFPPSLQKHLQVKATAVLFLTFRHVSTPNRQSFILFFQETFIRSRDRIASFHKQVS